MYSQLYVQDPTAGQIKYILLHETTGYCMSAPEAIELAAQQNGAGKYRLDSCESILQPISKINFTVGSRFPPPSRRVHVFKRSIGDYEYGFIKSYSLSSASRAAILEDLPDLEETELYTLLTDSSGNYLCNDDGVTLSHQLLASFRS